LAKHRGPQQQSLRTTVLHKTFCNLKYFLSFYFKNCKQLHCLAYILLLRQPFLSHHIVFVISSNFKAIPGIFWWWVCTMWHRDQSVKSFMHWMICYGFLAYTVCMLSSIYADAHIMTHVIYASIKCSLVYWLSHAIPFQIMPNIKQRHKMLYWVEIDQNGFFGTDTDTSAIHGPMSMTYISKIFSSCLLLHYQNILYMP